MLVLGPYEVITAYHGTKFGVGGNDVLISGSISEDPRVFGRRAAFCHPFSSDQLGDMRSRFLSDAVLRVVRFLPEDRVPPDWRYPDPDFLHMESDSRLARIGSDLRIANSRIVSWIAEDPERMHFLTPREFEETVAEILRQLGYKVELTPPSRDGGVDIWAASSTPLGTFLYAVQCKKRSPGHKVGVAVIRELYGAVERERATAGIVATTTMFTRGAHVEQQTLAHRMALRDFEGLHEWLRELGLTHAPTCLERTSRNEDASPDTA